MERVSALGDNRVKEGSGTNNQTAAGPLDRQYAELIEVVLACERQWTIDNRVDTAIEYGRA